MIRAAEGQRSRSVVRVLKEHAWKSTLAAHSNPHQNATTHLRSTTSATTMGIACPRK
jgi:hypothetical protein